MFDKLRKLIALIFDEADQGQHSSIKLSWTFLWFAVAGIIGGISPFICPSDHGLLVSSLASLLFIVLKAKPILKWLVKSQS